MLNNIYKQLENLLKGFFFSANFQCSHEAFELMQIISITERANWSSDIWGWVLVEQMLRALFYNLFTLVNSTEFILRLSWVFVLQSLFPEQNFCVEYVSVLIFHNWKIKISGIMDMVKLQEVQQGWRTKNTRNIICIPKSINYCASVSCLNITTSGIHFHILRQQ